MPKTSEMRESKFLKQSDIGTGALMTIDGCDRHNVAKEGAEPEHKWCLTFAETNIQICERIFGSDDTDHWIGQRVVLYVDPNVSYGGKVVGGIRIRAPKPQNQAAKPSKPVAVPGPSVAELTDDDIPF
jgi:hypothetical protein